MEKSRIVFCPACSSRREISEAKKPTLFVCLVSVLWAVLSGIPTLLLWSWQVAFWVALGFAVLSFAVVDVYYSLKFRRELVCPVCDFDPLLFRRSPEKAKQRCLQHSKRRLPGLKLRLGELEQDTANS